MTFDLTRLSVADTLLCSTRLRIAVEQATSAEFIGRQACSYLYDAFGDSHGERAVRLVRMYVTHPYAKLPVEDQQFARNLLNGPVARWPFLKCLTLLATRGDEDSWNDRKASRGHRAIPLPTTAILEQAPMIAQLFLQMGVELSTVLKPDPALITDLTRKTYNVFHVPRANGSPYIPAQDEFVRRYGIESVVGFGGALPWGEHFAVVLFARVPITAATAARFKSFALDIKARLLKSTVDDVFDSGEVRLEGPPEPPVKSSATVKTVESRVRSGKNAEGFRQFRDSQGVEWSVWAVVPSTMSVMQGRSQRWQSGWLLFESEKESRRLSPIPDNWATALDRELDTLCTQAKRGATLARPR